MARIVYGYSPSQTSVKLSTLKSSVVMDVFRGSALFNPQTVSTSRIRSYITIQCFFTVHCSSKILTTFRSDGPYVFYWTALLGNILLTEQILNVLFSQAFLTTPEEFGTNPFSHRPSCLSYPLEAFQTQRKCLFQMSSFSPVLANVSLLILIIDSSLECYNSLLQLT